MRSSKKYGFFLKISLQTSLLNKNPLNLNAISKNINHFPEQVWTLEGRTYTSIANPPNPDKSWQDLVDWQGAWYLGDFLLKLTSLNYDCFATGFIYLTKSAAVLIALLT